MTLNRLIEIKNGSISKYLSNHFNKKILIKEIHKLGAGCHGTAYKATSTDNESFILKQFNIDGRNMEFIEDRIKESLLIKRTSSEMENHVKTHSIAEVEDASIKEISQNEPIIIMEEVKGAEYFSELADIAKSKKLTQTNKNHISIIAQYLANIHSKKKPQKLYHRYLKDWFGYGILELTNELQQSMSKNKLFDLKKEFLLWEDRISRLNNRCKMIHGEFFPGTIHFDKDVFHTYDMRRIGAGEPADDVGSMLFNYYSFSIMEFGKVIPCFAEAAELFLSTYIKESNDNKIVDVLPCFMAYRCLILTNPSIVPMSKENRKVMQDLLQFLVKEKKLSHKKIMKKYGI